MKYLKKYETEAAAWQGEKAQAEKQRNESAAQLAQLQQDLQQANRQRNELQNKAASLEATVQQREAEYQQQGEQHNQMIATLKADIEKENMDKGAIQQRLQEQMDQSNQEAEQRLKRLALEKEQEIRQLQDAAETYKKLSEDLAKQISEKSVTIEQFKEKLTVRIVNKILFPSGRATINAEGRKVLEKVGAGLKENLEGRHILVEGHTDNVPIGPDIIDQYPTNWDLATARAVNVVRHLQEAVKIPAAKLSASGYGEHRPVADNKTEEGRALNRRIEIVITPELERSESQD